MRAKRIEVETAPSNATDKSTGWPYWMLGPIGAPIGRVTANRHGSVLYIQGHVLNISKDLEEPLALALLGVDQYRKA